MNLFYDSINFIQKSFGINYEYTFLIALTIIVTIVFQLLIKALYKIYFTFVKDSKKQYLFNKKIHIFFNILTWISIVFIWETHIKNVITLISFVSAAITISLREFIFNFFAGIYIKIKQPFKIEDRIEIDDIEGDIVNINALNFEILQTNKEENGEQSTGIIVHLPNSLIFTKPLKNYTKAFKYIWKEIVVKISLDSDIKHAKEQLYRIIRENDIINSIPKKMNNQINSISSKYRIYYNKLNPIIYTKIVDDHVELSLRYLVHPKKARIVEDEIWNKILVLYKNKEIELNKK